MIEAVWKDNTELHNWFIGERIETEERNENFKSILSSRYKGIVVTAWKARKVLQRGFIDLSMSDELFFERFMFIATSGCRKLFALIWEDDENNYQNKVCRYISSQSYKRQALELNRIFATGKISIMEAYVGKIEDIAALEWFLDQKTYVTPHIREAACDTRKEILTERIDRLKLLRASESNPDTKKRSRETAELPADAKETEEHDDGFSQAWPFGMPASPARILSRIGIYPSPSYLMSPLPLLPDEYCVQEALQREEYPDQTQIYVKSELRNRSGASSRCLIILII